MDSPGLIMSELAVFIESVSCAFRRIPRPRTSREAKMMMTRVRRNNLSSGPLLGGLRAALHRGLGRHGQLLRRRENKRGMTDSLPRKGRFPRLLQAEALRAIPPIS